ncbi:hypothetical protein H0H93_001683 [Arthromyces matolae]|nr:hypothetical protein H0H93_001683 [Arthromyces matolae]
MDSISRLRELLVQVLRDGTLEHGEQELFDELMVQKPRLLQVLNVGPRSPTEQKEIESGKTVINGKHVAVNTDFARQSIFLSQQLDCSERCVAEALYNVMSENPNIDTLNCLELAIARFHQGRRDLVDCVDLLIQAAIAFTTASRSSAISHLSEFVMNQLIYGVKEVDNVWGSRIFREIDGLDSLLATVDNARKCAPSLTTLATGQPGSTTTLGSDLLNSRYESLKYERRILATAYAGMGRLGVLSANEIKLTVDWLTRNMNHPMSYYMLTAALNALDSADPQSEEWSRRKSTVTNDKLNEYMGKVLSQSTSHIWKDPSLKSVIVLKWTLCQTEARHRDPSLETRAGFRTEELEGQIKSAIEGDAFVYLAYAVFGLLGKRSITSFASLAQKLQIKTDNEQQDHRILPSDDFKPVVLDAFETLIRLLITHASSEIRKIKAKQEDVASARHDRRFATSSSQPDASHRPRTDTAILFSLIGLLYSALPPERALQFWGSGPQSDTQQTYLEYMESTAGRLPSFLQWAVWSHGNDTAMLTALYDMLGGLAKGQQCSELAYNFMARGTAEVIPGSTLPSSSSAATTVSWVGIFGKLDGWARSPNTKPLQQQQQQQQQHFLGSTLGQSLARTRVPTTQNPPISVQDGVYAQAFLHLLSTVVTYSVDVRVAVAGHAQFCAIPTLVSLIPLGIPLELKGAVFETLSSFCEPGAGVNGVEICKAVWTLMEKNEVINVRVAQTGTFGATIPLKGVEAELAEIEAVHKQYPSTIPFLNLLSTLIHTPKRIPSAGRLTDPEPVNTIPETLGQPYRLPGISPFTAFIVDNVFDNIPNREYSRPSDRWQINDLCLCFIERAVASFDLEALVNHSDGAPVAPDTLVPLLVHPGFDVMKRLLSRTPLQARILSYLVEGVKGFDGNLADEEPYFRSTITRVLRIVQRVLEAQDIFLDVLIPLLAEFDSAPIVGPNHTRSFFNRFDLELSFGPQYIPALATYVAFPKYSELVFLSIRILTSLATSMPASNLSTLIGRSSESDRVLAGFVDALSAQSVEDVAHAEVLVEETTGAGAPDLGSQPDLTQSIRLAALSLLIQETEPSRPYPNLAHYILFGTTTSEHQIQDPHALGARRTSIHVILDLLNEGVPRLKGKGKERQREYVAPLFVTLPELAEKCYRVVYHLCTHPRTSDFTTRYLRTREDFFARQLACVPSPAPQTAHTPYIEVLYTDGARVISTSSSLSAFLRLRSCIFDLAALDLHILTSKGHLKGVSELLEILFSNPSDLNGEDDAYQFREIGQSHLRIIEFLQSLMFDWSDSLQVDALDLQFLGQLNIQSCVRINASGCEVIDRTAVFSLLNAAKRALHAQGAIATTAHAEQLQREAAYILESCIVENHRREISHSVAQGYQAWRRLLDLTLTKCFDRLPHGQRENMLFDLLHILPTAIRSPYIEEPTAVLLSEVVLSSITKLRENRRQQVIAQSASGNPGSGFLPAERLFAILRNVVECITENNRVELVRGNLYAALINYVHLLFSPKLEEHSSAATGKSDMSLSLSSSSMREGFSFDDSNSSLGWLSTTQNVGTLYTGSLEALRGSTERLIAIVSRDAIDGTEIWKTVAFMLLDALIQLSGAEKVHIISAPLTKHGILANVVRGVKEADARLLAILKPDPGKSFHSI